MSNVVIDRDKLDVLANAIGLKASASIPMTLSQMVSAVDGIQVGSSEPAITIVPYSVSGAGTFSASSGYAYSPVTVPSASISAWTYAEYSTISGSRKFRYRGATGCDIYEGEIPGWISHGTLISSPWHTHSAISKNTQVTPSTTSVTIGGSDYMMEGAVTIKAIPMANWGGQSVSASINTVDGAWIGTYTYPSFSAGYVSEVDPIYWDLDLESSTVTPSTTSQVVTPTDAYAYLYSVTVNAIPSAYIIPSGTSNITSNGTYNIASYESVSVSVSGGGGDSRFAKLLDRTISGTIEDSTVSVIGYNAFYKCTNLSSAIFSNATYISDSAFCLCSQLLTIDAPSVTNIGTNVFYGTHLSSASFPLATSVGANTFYSCSYLSTVNIEKASAIASSLFVSCTRLVSVTATSAQSVYAYAFSGCYSLAELSLPNVRNIQTQAFRSCTRLVSLYLMGSSIPVLNNSSTCFNSTPIGGYTASTGGVVGSIFVPSSLYSSYIVTANWSKYASRIVSM